MAVTIEHLFPTPVLSTVIDDHHDVSGRVALDLNRVSDCNGGLGLWETQSPGIQNLAGEFLRAAGQMKDLCGWQSVNLQRGWVVATCCGPHMDIHHHGGAALCGVYYLQADEGAGSLCLIDPRGSVPWPARLGSSAGNSATVKIVPKPGLMVVFPGYLLHCVEPNANPSVRRVSVATNFGGKF